MNDELKTDEQDDLTTSEVDCTQDESILEQEGVRNSLKNLSQNAFPASIQDKQKIKNITFKIKML